MNNVSKMFVEEIKKHINMPKSMEKQIINNVKDLDLDTFRSFKEGLTKLSKFENKSNLYEYILSTQNADEESFVNDFQDLKRKHVGIFPYYVSKIKQEIPKTILSTLAVSTVLLSPVTMGISVAIGGFAISIGLSAAKIASDSWGIANNDLIMIDGRIKSGKRDDDIFLERLFNTSKHIPAEIKKQPIEKQKEYMSDIISAFQRTDRYFKRTLKKQSFDDIVEIFERSQKELKKKGIKNISIRDYSLVDNDKLKTNKDYQIFMDHALLKHIKEKKDFRKRLNDNVNQLDKKDIEEFGNCVSKSTNALTLGIVGVLTATTKFEHLKKILNDNLKSYNINEIDDKVTKRFVEELLKLDLKKDISEHLYDDIKERVVDLDVSKKMSDFFLNNLDETIKSLSPDNQKIMNKIVEVIKDNNTQALMENTADLAPRMIKGVFTSAIESYLEDLKQQEYENRRFTEKLKEDGLNENIIGKILIVSLDKITDVLEDTGEKIKSVISQKNVDRIKEVKKITLKSAKIILNVLDTVLSIPKKLFAEIIPKNLGKLLNVCQQTKKTIKNFSNKIETDEMSFTLESVISLKIKNNKALNSVKIVDNFKSFIEDQKKKNQNDLSNRDPSLGF